LTENDINILYQYILDYSNNMRISNYFDFLCIMGSHYSKSEQELHILIDNVLKKILNNLILNTNIKNFDKSVKLSMKKYENDIAYELTTALINEYRKNKFYINNKQYGVLEMMGSIVKNKLSPKVNPIIYHYILAYLFRLHYYFCVKT